MDLPPEFDQKQPLMNGVLKSYFNLVMTHLGRKISNFWAREDTDFLNIEITHINE